VGCYGFVKSPRILLPCHTSPDTTEIWSECNATDNSTGHEKAMVCLKIPSLRVHGGLEVVHGNNGHSERPDKDL
jgi:hypothetical protein